MKNNIVVKLMQLKKSFLDSADNQSNLITNLSSITPELGEITRQTVNGGDGKPWIVSTIMDQGVKKLLIETWSDYSATNVEPDRFKMVPIDENGGVDLDTYVPELGKDVYAMLNDVRQTQMVNTAIAEVSAMFQTHSNVDVNTAIQYIDEITSSNSEGIIQLKQLMLKNAPEGKLSQYNYLSILNYVFSSSKDSLQHGSLTMNENGAYFISNAIGTIIMSAITLIANILTTVLSMVSAVLGVIVAAISSIFSVIGQFLNNAVKTDVTINPDCSLNIFDAPIFYISENGLDDHGRIQYSNDLSSEEARLYNRGSVSWYMWNNPEGNGGFMSNGFLSVSVSPVRAAEWLCNKFRLSFNPGTHLLSVAGSDEQSIDPNIYLTTEEIMALPTLSNQDLLELALYNLLFVGFARLTFSGVTGTMNTSNVATTLHDIVNIISSGNTPSEKYNSWTDGCCLLLILAAYLMYHGGNTWHEFLSMTNISVSSETATNMAITIQAGETELASGRPLDTNLAYWYGRTQTSTYSTSALSMNMEKSRTLSGGFITHAGGLKFHVSIESDCSVEEIPTTGMFSFANTRWSEVVWALAIIGAVSAATIIGVAVGKAKYKKWAVKKQLQEYSKLMQKRNNYIDDKGTIIGSNDDFKSYYKQIRKYNKWGRLLGYGTYDPTNNWTNAIETAVPDLSSIEETNASAISKLTNDGALDLNSISGSDGGQPITLSYIYHLITGN